MASKTIEINPVTRVEGHGKVTIQLDDAGNAVSARFHNTQFRGFEKFCEGQVFQEMPNLTARICGICPVSHQLASAKAGDAILGKEPTRPAKLLRELLHMGQFIQSHALHFFHLASPDFLLGFDSDPATRNIIGLIGADPALATEAVKLRSLGQTIIKKLGGKKVHMNAALPGGMTTALSAEDRDYFLKQMDWALADTQLAIKIFKEYVAANESMVNSFAKFPSAYLSLVDKDNNLALYDGNLRLVDSKGVVLEDQFDPSKYLDIIAEYVEDWSYMKFPFYKSLGYPGGIYRAGPLGRLNACTGITTPLANAEFKLYKKLSPNGLVEGSMFFHYARLIEIIYAIEKTREILEDKDVTSTDLQVTSTKYNKHGVGVVEAPRGTLFHDYWVDETGKITGVNLIVATGNNNAAMNRSVYEVAHQYIKNGKVTEGILNRVEAAIRCYDPCLSCSTHALGQMPLHIQLRAPDGQIVQELYS